MERHSFRIVSGELTETMQKQCLSTKFPHQEIRWNYSIFRSARHFVNIEMIIVNLCNDCWKDILREVFWKHFFFLSLSQVTLWHLLWNFRKIRKMKIPLIWNFSRYYIDCCFGLFSNKKFNLYKYKCHLNHSQIK